MAKTTKEKNLNRLQQVNLEYDVCGYIIQGLSRTEILEKIQSAYPNLTVHNADNVYYNAKEAIVNRVATEVEKVVDLHVRWYETIWRGFDELDMVPGKLAALRQKEKILGLMKEENVVKINNEFNIHIKSKPSYDLNKLSPEEQVRMEKYLKLVKQNDR